MYTSLNMFPKILIVSCTLALVAADVGDTGQIKEGAPPKPHNAPAPQKPVATITKQVNNFNPDGSYQYSHETSDGTAVEESGHPPISQEASVTGFKNVAPEGAPISVQHVADENDFQPEGPYLPGA